MKIRQYCCNRPIFGSETGRETTALPALHLISILLWCDTNSRSSQKSLLHLYIHNVKNLYIYILRHKQKILALAEYHYMFYLFIMLNIIFWQNQEIFQLYFVFRSWQAWEQFDPTMWIWPTFQTGADSFEEKFNWIFMLN